MKKLLALVLCVMLFVSVVPTSAFADTVVSGDAVDLSPAYEAQKALNNAFAQLAGATVIKNVYDSAVEYNKLFNSTDNPNAYNRTIKQMGNAWKNFKSILNQTIRNSGTGISPETLFSLFAPKIYNRYNNLAGDVVLDVKAKEDKAAGDAVDAYLKAVDEVKASTAEAVAGMLSAMTFPTV